MESEELACSSSDSDSEGSVYEEEIEEDGSREVVLVTKAVSFPMALIITVVNILSIHKACSEATQAQDIEQVAMLQVADISGGLGVSEFFHSVITSLRNEAIIMRAPRGKIVGELLDRFLNLESRCIVDIAGLLVSRIKKCLFSGKRHRLPSLAQGVVWTTFHKLRCDQDIFKAWQAFVEVNIPGTLHREHHLALQLIMKRTECLKN